MITAVARPVCVCWCLSSESTGVVVTVLKCYQDVVRKFSSQVALRVLMDILTVLVTRVAILAVLVTRVAILAVLVTRVTILTVLVITGRNTSSTCCQVHFNGA